MRFAPSFRAVWLAILAAGPLAGCAQGRWSMGVRGSWGWLSPHHASMWYLVERHAFMGEVFYERPFSGERAWHHYYTHPSWGVGLMMTDAGSPHLLGSVVRVLPYFDLPLISRDRFSFNARVGWGLGLVQHPWDRRDNHQQTVIGSRVNAAVNLALEAQRTIGRGTIGLGVALDHLSNGRLQVPNLGINMVTFGCSYRRWFGAVPEVIPDTVPSFTHSWSMEAMAAWGVQEVEPFESGQHSVYAVSATAYRDATRKSSFGVGVDLFNKASLAVLDPELADRPRVGLTQVGAHVGYALHFGGMSIVIDQGMYLLSPIDEKTFLFQRIGMRQRLGRHWFANITLKTHLTTADHFELGLGYHWK